MLVPQPGQLYTVCSKFGRSLWRNNSNIYDTSEFKNNKNIGQVEKGDMVLVLTVEEWCIKVLTKAQQKGWLFWNKDEETFEEHFKQPRRKPCKK